MTVAVPSYLSRSSFDATMWHKVAAVPSDYSEDMAAAKLEGSHETGVLSLMRVCKVCFFDDSMVHTKMFRKPNEQTE